MWKLIGWVDNNRRHIRMTAHLLVILSTLLVIFAFLMGEASGDAMVGWVRWWLFNLVLFFIVQFALREEE